MEFLYQQDDECADIQKRGKEEGEGEREGGRRRERVKEEEGENEVIISLHTQHTLNCIIGLSSPTIYSSSPHTCVLNTVQS